jgi:hypothetical protein
VTTIRGIPEWVLEIVRDYDAADVSPSFSLRIGGQEYGDRIQSCSWGWGEGAAQLLTARIGGRVPMRLNRAEVNLDVDIGGYEYEALRGVQTRISHPQEEYVTDLESATAGAYLEKTQLQQNFSILGWTPEQVVYNAVARVPYDRSKIRIHRFLAPEINRSRAGEGTERDDSMDETESAQDMLDIVGGEESEVKCVYFDTARGFRLDADPGLGEGQPVWWRYTKGSHELIKWDTPMPVDPDQEYSKVVVLDKSEDGLTDRIREERDVYHRGSQIKPWGGSVLHLPFTDRSVGASERAALLCFKTAELAGRGIHTVSGVEVAFNPFLWPYRPVVFAEDHRDDDGMWYREWLAIVQKDLTHSKEAGVAKTTFSVVCVKLVEELIPDPQIALPGVSAGTVSTGSVGVPYGEVVKLGQTYDFVNESYIDAPVWAGEVEIGGQVYDWFDPDAVPTLLYEISIDGQVYDAFGHDDASVVFSTWGQDDVHFYQEAMNVPYSELG